MPGPTRPPQEAERDVAPAPTTNDDGPSNRFAGLDRHRQAWVAVVAVLAVVALVVTVLVARGTTPFFHRRAAAPTSPTPSPPPTPLSLQLTKVVAVAVVGTAPQGSGQDVAESVSQRLSEFYQQTLGDPAAWAAGPPGSAWEAFAVEIRDRAKADATAFTLGKAGSSMESLSFDTAVVSVHVLLDAKGKPAVAEATVTIDGTGSMRGTGAVNVSVRADLLLSPSGGGWLITGYPHAEVTVKQLARSPTPGPPTDASPTAPAGTTTGSSP